MAIDPHELGTEPSGACGPAQGLGAFLGGAGFDAAPSCRAVACRQQELGAIPHSWWV